MSASDLAGFVLGALERECSKMRNQSLQLSLRWRRYVSGQLQTDLELNLAAKQYEAQVAQCARQMHQLNQALKGLKSFEEAQLVQEEWKGRDSFLGSHIDSQIFLDFMISQLSLLRNRGLIRNRFPDFGISFYSANAKKSLLSNKKLRSHLSRS